jgi:hypothetical protein
LPGPLFLSIRDSCRGSVLFGEVVRVDPLDLVHRHGAHPQVMVNHQAGELVSIDEGDLVVDLEHVVARVSREAC